MARKTDSAREGQPDRATILRALCEMYAGPAWHGPSVLAALKGVSAEKAAWRVAPGRNTIWELVLHLAHARHLLIRRLNPQRRDRFPRKLRVQWWPELPAELTETAWRADQELLRDCQEDLLAEVAAAPQAGLNRIRAGKHCTIAHELLGVALHDGYHAGQIRLLSKL